jgi:penicillin amidase
MRILRFLLALAATGGLIWQLQRPQAAGDKTLPPLGDFFNPFSGFWKNAAPAIGFRAPDAQMQGLSGPCQVLYDDLMVPHIFAQNLRDAARVQGYVTASQRLWQMDISSRKAGGRLSEVLGERTLAVDKMTRRRGMVFAAERNLEGWKKSPEDYALLEAYTEGVNAYLAQLKPADYPIEFKLLHYKPEPWNVLKTALIIEGMAETLCAGENDLRSTNALAHFGRETFDALYPLWNPKQQPIIPDTGQWKNIRPPVLGTTPSPGDLSAAPGGPGASPGSIPEMDGYLEGSNNWAVGGSRSATGNPILANDPHLSLSLPSIWFQVQLHTPQQNCYGVALPGVPGVIIGFNNDIAWGVTNVGHDVSDWYKVQWADAARTQYRVDGTARLVQLRVETIAVKGKPPVLDTVRYTEWGPVVHDDKPGHPMFDCALHWITHEVPPPGGMATFLQLNAGKNYTDYRTALSGYDCPAQNFVFATRTGDIAMQVQGRFPIRGEAQGRFVSDGSQSANAWQGFVPNTDLPGMRNPSRGFVYSANQHSTPPSYPYFYLGSDFEDYRSRRIFSRLENLRNATADSLKAMQMDNFSQRAADALPAMFRLLNQQNLDADGQKMASELVRWQYNYDADQSAPPLFEVWYDSCYLKTWDEMDALRQQEKDILFPDGWRLIQMLESDTSNAFFDHPNTPARENARDIVNEAFLAMQGYFRSNPDKRASWGQYRPVQIKHLGQIEAFSRMNLAIGGHKSAPNAQNYGFGPSWRMVVELGDKPRAYGVYPGGQSGNPGSPYYDNMVDYWAKGQYYELLFLQSPEEGDARILGKQIFDSKK